MIEPDVSQLPVDDKPIIGVFYVSVGFFSDVSL